MKLKKIGVNPRHPCHPRSINPYTDLETGLSAENRRLASVEARNLRYDGVGNGRGAFPQQSPFILRRGLAA
jgi:hypothetical protein